MTPLPHLYTHMLLDLYERGGSATVDRFGVLITSTGPVQGPMIGWLVLVSHGLLGGEHGKLVLTELAR